MGWRVGGMLQPFVQLTGGRIGQGAGLEHFPGGRREIQATQGWIDLILCEGAGQQVGFHRAFKARKQKLYLNSSVPTVPNSE